MSTVATTKNTVERFNIRFEQAEERTGELETMQPEEKKEKRMNNNEQSLWDVIKLINFLILGVPKKTRDRKGR